MSWEFRLSNLYDSLTSHLQIISRYEVLSKSFPQKTQEAEVIDIEKKIILLSFSSIRSFLYSDLWGFVRLCILYCSLGH